MMGYEIHAFSCEPEGVCKKYADYYYPIPFAEREKVLKECRRIDFDDISSFSFCKSSAKCFPIKVRSVQNR
jgi:hypothetical protein